MEAGTITLNVSAFRSLNILNLNDDKCNDDANKTKNDDDYNNDGGDADDAMLDNDE